MEISSPAGIDSEDEIPLSAEPIEVLVENQPPSEPPQPAAESQTVEAPQPPRVTQAA